jgi:hypothetical protein
MQAFFFLLIFKTNTAVRFFIILIKHFILNRSKVEQSQKNFLFLSTHLMIFNLMSECNQSPIDGCAPLCQLFLCLFLSVCLSVCLCSFICLMYFFSPFFHSIYLSLSLFFHPTSILLSASFSCTSQILHLCIYLKLHHIGDFWHVRGALCVDLLNRVLASLKQWTQPVIMIPGNHDQVRG